MPGNSQKQTITVEYVATEAQRQAAKWASDEQRRTKETADVAKKAAKDVVEAQKRADKERKDSDASVNALLKQHSRDETSTARTSSQAQATAVKQAARQQMIALSEKHKLAMAQWALEQTAARETAAASANSTASTISNMVKAQVTLSTLKGVADAMNSVMKDASDYTSRVANSFITTQKAMQGIAALAGKTNTNAFTLSEIEQGAAANLKPEQFTAFRDAFLSKASNYVGDKPTAKLSAADSDKFQASLAEYAALHGVPAAEMADFAGGLLAQAPGKTDAATMTTQAGKVFATLEASSAKVGHLLPHMTRVMAQGFSATEAAPMLAQLPEIAPEEEGTHMLRLIAEVRQLSLDKKEKPFGITKGMRPAAQIEALIGNLAGRQAKGEDLDTMIQGVTKEQIAGNTLRGLVRQGPAGLKQWKDILKNTPDDQVATDILAGRQSDAGQQMHAEAQLAKEEAVRGARMTGVERLKLEATAQLTKEGRWDTPHIDDYLRKPLSWIKGTSVHDQLVNERAVDLANQRSGLPPGQQAPLVAGAAQQVADERMRRLLELMERQNVLLEQNAAVKQKRPLAVRPPGAVPRP
jgi:hypothetical protein